MKNRKSQVPPLGERLAEGLSQFLDTLESGEPIESRYTVHTIMLDLEPQPYDGRTIRATRARLGVSQAIFARLLGVSVDLVQCWEQGTRKASKMACRLLDEINRDRRHWLELLTKASKRKILSPKGPGSASGVASCNPSRRPVG